MSGRLIGARLLHGSTSTVNLFGKRPNCWFVPTGFSRRINFPFKFHVFSIGMDSMLAEKLMGSSRNNVVVLGTRKFSGRSFRSERAQENETLSRRRKDFKSTTTSTATRRGNQSKRVVDDEMDLDDWFDDREMSSSSKRRGGNVGLSKDSSSFSTRRTLKDSNAGSRSTRGPGGLSNAWPRSRPSRQALKFSDEEDEDEDKSEMSSLSKRGRGNVGLSEDSSFFSTRRTLKDSNAGSRSTRGAGGLSNAWSRARPSRQALKFSEEEDEDESDLDVASSSTDDEEFDSRDVFEAVQPKSSVAVKESPKTTNANDGEDSYLSQTRFDQCNLSPLSLRAIKSLGYERMTIVQEATLPAILQGKDVLAKAKTGTGKTVAFLLPSIEMVVKSPPVSRDQKRPPILVLVICPTRELASQAAAEADKLLKYHANIGVQVVIGGTKLPAEQKRLQANPCQILMATPGRLRDHIENTPGFSSRLMGVKVLILDEADRLLDMGFRRDIENIVAAVPKQRQTLLFSATVPDEVHQISRIALRRDHEFINTVEEGSQETHSKVLQSSLVESHEKHFHILFAILREHISQDTDYKVLVFCTTAMVTRLVAEVLAELKLNVREIHSRKSQGYRTRISDEFRKSKGLILVTSDVSARGVDYPDVTLVVQMGIPSDREQYIHRLGRTGRKGKEGQGILLLAPWEEYFLASVKDLPISKAPSPHIDSDMILKVQRALSNVEMKDKESAYQAWLGYYNSLKEIGGNKTRLVELANVFSRSMGLEKPPAIAKLTLSKMGLKNVPGLRSK